MIYKRSTQLVLLEQPAQPRHPASPAAEAEPPAPFDVDVQAWVVIRMERAAVVLVPGGPPTAADGEADGAPSLHAMTGALGGVVVIAA